MFDFGREVCGDIDSASKREWLVTNGIGGYAAGTVSGVRSRRYHGLLVATLKPPVGRTILVAKLDEIATYRGNCLSLYASVWPTGVVNPNGFQYLERFRLEGTTPVWSYACADALLEKRIWMEQGANTTYVRYDLVRAAERLDLTANVMVTYRDHHDNTLASDWRQPMDLSLVPQGMRVTAYSGATPFYVLCDGAETALAGERQTGFHLSVEAYRGLDESEDLLCAGHMVATLLPGDSLTIVSSTLPNPCLDGVKTYVNKKERERVLISKSASGQASAAERQLILSADQFVVQRSVASAADSGSGHSIIAGYPWFGDWGRDTMISLPGLTLAVGRPEIAASILRTFAHYLDQGMLPNRFPDTGTAPEYNTVDATLWYFEAIRAYYAVTKDAALVRDLFPVLEDIVAWHLKGTRHSIGVDKADGLLYAGEPGVQLTWMDAKVDDWVVTPRIGKPVEVNALWYNALWILTDLAKQLDKPAEPYLSHAKRAADSFCRFWNHRAGYCYDVIDGPNGSDPALRPNQIFAVALPHSPLDERKQRSVVDACAASLVTSHGLRSLAPDHADYVGHYGGDRRQRDAAYHQGTVWGWLIGPFVQAHLRVYGNPVLAKTYLRPLLQHLNDHGVGTISEVFDGDPPHSPRGCFAQAWSVAEVLRLGAILDRSDFG